MEIYSADWHIVEHSKMFISFLKKVELCTPSIEKQVNLHVHMLTEEIPIINGGNLLDTHIPLS